MAKNVIVKCTECNYRGEVQPRHLVRSSNNPCLQCGGKLKFTMPTNMKGNTMVRHGKKDGSKQKRTTPKAEPKPKKKQKKRAGSEKKKKPAKKTGYRKGSLREAINIYITKVGYEKVTYKAMEAVAKKVKPDTKFNHSHYSWYRNKYRQEHGID